MQKSIELARKFLTFNRIWTSATELEGVKNCALHFFSLDELH